MAIEFPQNPDNLDEHTEASKTWQWQSAVNAWVLIQPGDNLSPPVGLINTLPNEIILFLRAHEFQLQNQQEWQDFEGTVVGSISPDGTFLFPGGVMTGQVSNPPTNAANGTIDLDINNNFNVVSLGNIEITLINGAGGQSGFIYVNNNAGHVVTLAADLLFPDSTAPVLGTGQHLLGFYFTGGGYLITSATEMGTA